MEILIGSGSRKFTLQVAASEGSLLWMQRTQAVGDIPKQEQYIKRKRESLQQGLDKAALNQAEQSTIMSWRWCQ